MEQQIQLNDHNKQEYPPMHTAEHLLNATTVSYTHLDVYKRQLLYSPHDVRVAAASKVIMIFFFILFKNNAQSYLFAGNLAINLCFLIHKRR